ncbi:MAG TPA: NUDIX hydrolase [Candidatus Acidoferrales bacterium]|nr:NUDIX hydrolase [Candidatus Acidoferrales bacterium]
MVDDPYERLRKRRIYANAWLAVDVHDIVHAGGVPGEHVVLVTPDPCAVVVEDGDGLIFAVQPRFAAGRRAIEIVKGGRNPGETALECARRELREELGLAARSWVELGRLYEIPSVVAGPVTLFLARELDRLEAAPEPQEQIESLRMTVAEAFDAAASGAIDDAVTIAALFRYGRVRGRL